MVDLPFTILMEPVSMVLYQHSRYVILELKEETNQENIV